MIEKMKGVLAAIAAVAALAVGGAAIAGAAGVSDGSSQPTASKSDQNEDRNDSEATIGGSALGKAGAAALAQTGGGQVTDTEVGDEESYYEVEVTRQDGGQVDVQLDRDFAVVGTSADGQED